MFRLALATMLMVLVSCGTDEGEPGPGGDATYRVSDCGGFASAQKSTYDAGYCDANVLAWSHDAAAGTLTLTDERVLLNCCGDHSVTVTQEAGTFVVTELDAPQDGMRCRCMCVFDFEITLDVSAVSGPVQLKLVRDVTDDDQPAQTVFTGALDLSQGQGSEVLDSTDVNPWCDGSVPQDPQPQDPQPQPDQPYAISECGGFAQEASDSYGPSSYCDAELLRWKRDAATGTVTFTDQRVELNCCGDRSISASDEGGTLVITVTDAPESGAGRCYCMCVFDFAITVGPLSGQVPVKLVREVTDDNEPPKTVYSGTLDLSTDVGAVVVDQSPAPFCS